MQVGLYPDITFSEINFFTFFKTQTCTYKVYNTDS